MNQEELKKLVAYDPLTGDFTSIKARGPAKIGKELGTLTHKGYLCVTINKKYYELHRLAFLYMEGEMPKVIDHINRVPSDNRWVNLRSANHSINNRNRNPNKRNKSGVVGVFWHKRDKKWLAIKNIDGKNVELCRTNDFNEAVRIRKEAGYE